MTFFLSVVALVHGDVHFSTFDGLDFTFNDFGEYVLLKSTPFAPVQMMMHGRTFIPKSEEGLEYRATILM